MRYSFLLTNNILNTTSRIRIRTLSSVIMPMDRPSVEATRNHRLSRREKEPAASLANRLFFQIIGDASKGNPRSLMVSSENHSYLFNCGEGFQRLAYENKVKLTRLENVFVTSLGWEQLSGVFGTSLTLHDIGLPKLCLHGPDGIGSLFTSISGFVDHSISNVKTWSLSTRTPDQGDFEDPGLHLKYIQLEPSNLQGNTSLESQLHLTKRQKTSKTSLAYICKAPDLAGTLDVDKCIKLKVPVGPKLGILKKGQDVTLDDGRLIRSTDVVGQSKPGPLFIVLECPSLSYIDSLVNNPDIKECTAMRQSEASGQVSFVCHYCPDSVFHDDRYRTWIKEFSPDCKHIVMNSSNGSLNFLGIHCMQTQLNLLDPTIFPILADGSSNDSVKDILIAGPTEIIRPKNLDKFVFRPAEAFESTEHKIDTPTYLQEAFDIEHFKENLDNLHNLQGEFKSEQPSLEEPELIFFGTGSSMPSKIRNCSCIYLKMGLEDSMLMDCGEGTFGQIHRFFGKSFGDILARLKLVFISHYHADHHLGLIEIIRQRKYYTDEPLSVIAPPQIKIWLDHYCQSFEDLSPHIKLHLSHTFESVDSMRTTSRKLMEHTMRTQDKYERSSPSPPRSPSQDSMSKQQLLSRLPVLKNVQSIKVRHCSNAYAIAIDINLPSGKNYSIAYSGDAMPSNEFITRAKGCDLLIHEATLADHLDAEARMKRHSTFSQAIDVGKRMEAKFTLLTHFSQRYAKIPPFNEKFDDQVGFAFDNMKLRLPSDLKRIPILKPILNVLFSEHIEELEDSKKKAQFKQDLINKYLDERTGTDCLKRLDAKEVLERVRNERRTEND